eukprot:TRINITY_DN66554_c0_g1_i1.p1 TRINITY_DN66554_c0_g1~~TRINITY_DN66554_c0_g1_i1.p1  ORF type:complete len:455 (+),score=139.62 TRINITY_DN66554_c0_g1_i1:115-1479(+)
MSAIHRAAAAERSEHAVHSRGLVRSGKRKCVNGPAGQPPAQGGAPDGNAAAGQGGGWRSRAVCRLRAAARSDPEGAAVLLGDLAVADSAGEVTGGAWEAGVQRALAGQRLAGDCRRIAALLETALAPIAAPGELPEQQRRECSAFLLSAKAAWLKRGAVATARAAAAAEAETGEMPLYRFGQAALPRLTPAQERAVEEPPPVGDADVGALHDAAVAEARQLPPRNAVRLRCALSAARFWRLSGDAALCERLAGGALQQAQSAGGDAAAGLLWWLAHEREWAALLIAEHTGRDRVSGSESSGRQGICAQRAAALAAERQRRGAVEIVAEEGDARYEEALQQELAWQRLLDAAYLSLLATLPNAGPSVLRIQALFRGLKDGTEGRIARRRALRGMLDDLRAEGVANSHAYLREHILLNYGQLEDMGAPLGRPEDRAALRYADRAKALGGLHVIPPD